MAGFFNVDRDIYQDGIFHSEEPFSLRECYFDLLFLARWQDDPKVCARRGNRFFVCKNQIAMSVDNLRERWHLARATIYKNLQILEENNLIKIQRNNVCNIIEILNMREQQNEQQKVPFCEQQKENENQSVTGDFVGMCRQQNEQQKVPFCEQLINNSINNNNITTTTTFSTTRARNKKDEIENFENAKDDEIDCNFYCDYMREHKDEFARRYVSSDSDVWAFLDALVEFRCVNNFDGRKQSFQKWHVEFYLFSRKRIPELLRDRVLDENAKRNWRGR